ncbi:hypothetical protein AYI70_g2822 [Smittium culicis]|uniref:Uncharacterized protein n=1 Tax=Smittium culicis TaxID=133412 RepID=A0A1R1Y6Q5_9FUNG|nr:hypothetical protein AYI70_g2822 [Smittium culicis]
MYLFLTKSSNTINLPNFNKHIYPDHSQRSRLRPVQRQINLSYLKPEGVETAVYGLHTLLKWKNWIINGVNYSSNNRIGWWPFENFDFPNPGPAIGDCIDVNKTDLVSVDIFFSFDKISKLLDKMPEYYLIKKQKELYISAYSEELKSQILNKYNNREFNSLYMYPLNYLDKIKFYKENSDVDPGILDSFFNVNINIWDMFKVKSIKKDTDINSIPKEIIISTNNKNGISKNPGSFKKTKRTNDGTYDKQKPSIEDKIYLYLYAGKYLLFLKPKPGCRLLYSDTASCSSYDSEDSFSHQDPLLNSSEYKSDLNRLIVFKKLPLEDLVLFIHSDKANLDRKKPPTSQQKDFFGLNNFINEHFSINKEATEIKAPVTITFLTPSRISKIQKNSENRLNKKKEFEKLEAQYCSITVLDERLAIDFCHHLLNFKFLYRQKIVLKILEALNSV